MRVSLLYRPRNHVLASSPSSVRGIASSSTFQRCVLRLFLLLPILVRLLLSPVVVLGSWGRVVPSPYRE